MGQARQGHNEKMAESKPDRFEQDRLKKLKKIEALGFDPWGGRFDGHMPIARARELCPEEPGVRGQYVRVAGRILRRRKAGKLRFYDIKDWTGKIQLLFSRGDVGEQQWELLSAIDLGDIIGIDGWLWKTDTGEKSVFVDRLTPLCKSLAQPPEKYHGARDIELLLRRRYIDLIYNEGVLERMLKRTKIIDSIRETLKSEGFVEVETPMLHAVAGGAAARPFVTHHNALDIDLYLRIAPELHLKRLLVGGLERVFEIGRVFRNEGIDATHNPEFTMIEIYQAYGDYRSMMDLTEKLIVNAVRSLGESLQVPWGEQVIDFTPPWPRRTYAELFREHVGCDMLDRDAVKKAAAELEIETEAVHPDVVVDKVFEQVVHDRLTGPVFVIDYPASICPLTKRKREQPEIAERFELFVCGMELANAYTELTDPYLQEELFRTQLAGLPEEESMARMDRDFIQALKVGMPPAGGLGIGIDRLVMLLTNSRTIRDVIFFPLLRPEQPQRAEDDQRSREAGDRGEPKQDAESASA